MEYVPCSAVGQTAAMGALDDVQRKVDRRDATATGDAIVIEDEEVLAGFD